MPFLARRCVDDDSLSYTYCANPRLGLHPAVACTAATQQSPAPSGREFAGLISSNVNAMIKEGRQTFRYDTFDDEGFWSDAPKFH